MKFKNLALSYIFLDVVLISIMTYFGSIYVLNSQIAFICSNAILFASFYGYKKRAEEKSRNYKLSDKEEAIFNDEDLGLEKQIPRDDQKFRKVDIVAAFKPYRLFAYLILILAFFILLRRDLFEPISFLIGISIMPLGVFLNGVLNHDK